MTRGSPNRKAGALLPSAVSEESATRSKAGLARTQPCPTRSVSSNRELTARALVWSWSRCCKQGGVSEALEALSRVAEPLHHVRLGHAVGDRGGGGHGDHPVPVGGAQQLGLHVQIRRPFGALDCGVGSA